MTKFFERSEFDSITVILGANVRKGRRDQLEEPRQRSHLDDRLIIEKNWFRKTDSAESQSD